MVYKVTYRGVAYVRADSPEEAEDDYEFSAVLEEREIIGVEEAEDFDLGV